MTLPLDYIDFSLDDFRQYQLAQLRDFVEKISKVSPYYTKVLKDADKITSYEAFRQLPFLEQQTLREGDVEDFLAVPWKDVLTVSRSSGTTGKSKLALWSKQSIETQKEWCRIGFSAAGFTQNARFAYFVPLELNPRLLVCAEMSKDVGVFCIPIGKLKTVIDVDNAIDLVKTLRATAFLGTPSRLVSITERIQELGLDPKKDFAIKTLISGGGVLSARQRALLEDTWGAEVFDFLATNELSYIAFECSAHDGLHLMPGMNYVEIIDPETKEPILEDSKVGEVVITQFTNLATPLLRYRIGDLGCLTYKKCACGLAYPRLRITGRISGTIAIGGTKMYAFQIESILSQFTEISLDYQAVIEKQDKSVVVTLRIETKLPNETSQAYKERIIDALTHDPAIVFEIYDKLTTGELQFNIEFITPGSLEKNAMDKIKNQFVDKRAE